MLMVAAVVVIVVVIVVVVVEVVHVDGSLFCIFRVAEALKKPNNADPTKEDFFLEGLLPPPPGLDRGGIPGEC